MKVILRIGILLVFFCLIFNLGHINAQCAQCAAAVESDAKNGNTAVNGLNNGILFLLAAPYLAVAIGGYVWYKKYRRKNIQIDIRGEKLNLN